MKSNYKKLGEVIRKVNIRNKELNITNLMGINIEKFFMPSVANTVGTDMSKYRIVNQGQFACNRMHVGRDKRLPVALWNGNESIIVSPAYDVFEVIDTEVLEPDYLMMWFLREEFDRNAWFYTDADVRGGLNWEDFSNMPILLPSIIEQRKIIKEFNILEDRIKLNNQIILKLEKTAQLIFQDLFFDSENTDSNRKVKLSNYIETNPKLSLKKNAISTFIELNDITTTTMCIKGFVKRKFTGGSKFQNYDTLLARITPSLENGKTAFVDILEEGEIAAGSTEFIVMRAKESISPYWVYCLARDENFRSYAISSMVGSSGRQRVHEDYLGEYVVNEVDFDKMNDFHNLVKTIFARVKLKAIENKKLSMLKMIFLLKLAKAGE
ncbi:hypothetical protein ACTHOQ_18070 [Solibacillus silvestris]|uniref:hypothetical protein n=1 Tax=Solibacillus silvestris TaxID=76853 RepID=UPI003F7EEC34